MRMMRSVVLPLLCLLMQPVAYSAVTKLVVDIATRPGVTVRKLYNAPDSPTAHLVLFTGNFGPIDGYVGIQADGSVANAPPNYDQRINDWIARGVSFTVVDLPIDRSSLDAAFRRSGEHAADLLAVIRYLQQRWYTMGANVATGAASVALPILQNVGGNFNAPPITNSTQVGTATKLYETTGGLFDPPMPVPNQVEVGTATLTFQSCIAATLDYTFTGGSSAGAAGRIALTKIAPTSPGCAT